MAPATQLQAQTVGGEVGRVDLGEASYEPVELPQSLPQLNGIFREVARRVRPTVVFLEVGVEAEQELPDDGRHELDEEFLRKYFEPRIQDSAGSGVLISRSGYIVTNHHVVKNAVDVQVVLHDKRRYEAEIIGSDPTTDIAVLRIHGTGEFPAIAFGNSSEIEVGEWVLAIGNPFRLESTVTSGIVSGLGRQVRIIEDEMGIEDFIQTDAAINPGNSGGALVNLRGELVGINTAIATRRGVSEGYGFAVPVNLVERVAEDLIAYGEVRRGYLGIQISELTPSMARDRGFDRVEGILIMSVVEGGAADRAGLQAEDVLLAVEGHEINATNELQSLIATEYRPGDVVRVRIRRDGQIRHFSVELFTRDGKVFQDWLSSTNEGSDSLGADQESRFSLTELEDWGIGLRNLEDEQVDTFGLERGAYVAYVRGGSPASEAGLPRDAVITAIEETEVESAPQVREVLRENWQEEETVLVRVRRRDQTTAFYELHVPGTVGE
jgi:Do/DeqQ family serine protease